MYWAKNTVMVPSNSRRELLLVGFRMMKLFTYLIRRVRIYETLKNFPQKLNHQTAYLESAQRIQYISSKLQLKW